MDELTRIILQPPDRPRVYLHNEAGLSPASESSRGLPWLPLPLRKDASGGLDQVNWSEAFCQNISVAGQPKGKLSTLRIGATRIIIHPPLISASNKTDDIR
jgi:hypothetical protein